MYMYIRVYTCIYMYSECLKGWKEVVCSTVGWKVGRRWYNVLYSLEGNGTYMYILHTSLKRWKGGGNVRCTVYIHTFERLEGSGIQYCPLEGWKEMVYMYMHVLVWKEKVYCIIIRYLGLEGGGNVYTCIVYTVKQENCVEIVR